MLTLCDIETRYAGPESYSRTRDGAADAHLSSEALTEQYALRGKLLYV